MRKYMKIIKGHIENQKYHDEKLRNTIETIYRLLKLSIVQKVGQSLLMSPPPKIDLSIA